MARETRRQRRDQRKSSGAAVPAAAGAQRTRSSQPPVRPDVQPPSTQTGRREPRQRGRFVRESYAELRKVEWPNRTQVLQGTVVVIIACVIIGSFLYLCDQVFSKLVEKILLGQ